MTATTAPDVVEASSRARVYLLALAIALIVVWAIQLAIALVQAPVLGWDFDLYIEATERWLAGDGFYLDRQLQGPYVVLHGDVLYPPLSLYLFIPFVVLPGILWWAIPIGAIVWSLWRLRPAPAAWVCIALCLLWPETSVKIAAGGPVIWITAAVALGTVYAWPAAFALLKPTLAPFALIGIRHRSWWVTVGVMALASIPLLGLWQEYVGVLLDARHPSGILYSIREVPIVLIPVIAMIGRQDRRRIDPSPSA